MEIKKSPKADLQNKRGLLLEIGLVVALVLVIAAFAYTPKEHRIEKVDLNYGPVEEEITEITRQDQKPPEPPKKVEVKVIADLLQVVTNDTKITTEVDFAEFDENTEVIQQVEVVEETIEDDQPFLIAETMPSFQGGDLNTFRNWVQQNVKFPQIGSRRSPFIRLVLHAEINGQGILHTYNLITLFSGTPLRRLVQPADRLFRKRTVGGLEHLNIGQTAVLLDHERENHTTLDTVFLSNNRILD